MRLLREQKGLTLVELLIGLGIAAMISGTLATAIFQIFDRSVRGQEVLRSLHDMQNAGRWLYLDGERAEATDLVNDADPVGTMTFSWTADGEAHTATYYMSGAELRRDHNGTVTTVARHLANAEFSISNELITIDLVSIEDSTGESKAITYNIWLRPAN